MNSKLLKYFFPAAVLLFTAVLVESCSESEFQTTESGMQFRFEKNGTGPSPENGDVLVMNVSYLDESGQTIFSTAEANGPMAIGYNDSLLNRMGGLEEGLKMIKGGDSLIMQYPIEDLFEGTFNMPLPDSLKRGTKVLVCIGLKEVLTPDEFTEYQQKESERLQTEYLAKSRKKIDSDGEKIDAYLSKNGIEAIIDKSGLRYTVLSEGDGDIPQKGETVRVNYTGKLLDGTVFDTSIEEIAKSEGTFNPGRPYEPYQFPLGAGAVIKGWDIGIGLLKAGTKAVLYVPSPIGYGDRGSGAIIPPNAILIFDVELVEVVK